MIVFLNGRFVGEEEAVVSVFDRSFLYGDGLFETLRVLDGFPLYWTSHLRRLQDGARLLGIRLPFAEPELRGFASELLRLNALTDAVLRITLSRGSGPRGYSYSGADTPSVVMTLHPPPLLDPTNPPGWRLITSSFRVVANDPLAQFKTANKLTQIMAHAEAEAAGAHEALILNTDGHAAEAACANLFWVVGGRISTPPLQAGILAGITRQAVLDICHALDTPVREELITLPDLKRADSLFLTLSTLGIVEVLSLDKQSFQLSPTIERLRHAYHEHIGAELTHPSC